MIRQLSAFMMPRMFCISDDPSHHEVHAALLSCFLCFVGPVNKVNNYFAHQAVKKLGLASFWLTHVTQ